MKEDKNFNILTWEHLMESLNAPLHPLALSMRSTLLLAASLCPSNNSNHNNNFLSLFESLF